MKRAYVDNFSVKLREEDKPWGSSYCKQNIYGVDKEEKLLKSPCTNGLEPRNHFDEFFLIDVTDTNQNNKWANHDLLSARRLVPHSNLVSITTVHELPQLSRDESCTSDSHRVKNMWEVSDFQTTSQNERFNQNEVSDLIKDLNFSKE